MPDSLEYLKTHEAATPTQDVEADPLAYLKTYEAPAGSHPSAPLQEAAIGAWERHQVMNYAPNPESAVRWLKKEHPDWEVVQYGAGYKIAVQKPGEPWKVVDPQGFDVWDLSDIASDVGVGAVSAAGAVGGAILGTGAAPGVGTFGGGALGSAAGAAVGEAGRQGLGAIMGFEAPLSERAAEVGMAAATGLVAEGAGRVIGGIGKAALAKIPAGVKESVKRAIIGGPAVEAKAGVKSLTTSLPEGTYSWFTKSPINRAAREVGTGGIKVGPQGTIDYLVVGGAQLGPEKVIWDVSKNIYDVEAHKALIEQLSKTRLENLQSGLIHRFANLPFGLNPPKEAWGQVFTAPKVAGRLVEETGQAGRAATQGLLGKGIRGVGQVLEKGGKLAQAPERLPSKLLEMGTTLTKSSREAQAALGRQTETVVGALEGIVEKYVPDAAQQNTLRGIVKTAKEDLSSPFLTTAERKEVVRRLSANEKLFREAVKAPVKDADTVIKDAFSTLKTTAGSAPSAQGLPFVGRVLGKLGPAGTLAVTFGPVAGFAYKAGTLGLSMAGKKIQHIGRALIEKGPGILASYPRLQRYSQVLQNVLDKRGKEAYKATVYTLLNNTGFRSELQGAGLQEQ